MLSVAVECDSLLVLFEFCRHFLDLGPQEKIFVVCGFRCLFQILHLSLEVLQMLLLTLSECTLCCSVLGLTLLPGR